MFLRSDGNNGVWCPDGSMSDRPSTLLIKPVQTAVGASDQRNQPRFGALAARSPAVKDIQCPEPAQLPPHVVQIQYPGFVDTRPDIGDQPGHRIVAGGRGELTTGDQLPRQPANNCSTSSTVGGMRSCGSRSPRPIDLIEWAFNEHCR